MPHDPESQRDRENKRLDPDGWISGYPERVKAIFFDSPDNRNLLRQIRRARFKLTTIRAVGWVFAPAVLLVFAATGGIIGASLPWLVCGVIAGYAATYKGLQALEHRFRSAHMELWRRLGERISRSVQKDIQDSLVELDRRRLNELEVDTVKKAMELPLSLFNISDLGRRLSEQRSLIEAAQIAALLFVPLIAPFMYLYIRHLGKKQLQQDQQTIPLALERQKSVSDYQGYAFERGSSSEIKNTKFQGIQEAISYRSNELLEAAVNALLKEREQLDLNELETNRRFANLATVFVSIAGFFGVTPSTIGAINATLAAKFSAIGPQSQQLQALKRIGAEAKVLELLHSSRESAERSGDNSSTGKIPKMGRDLFDIRGASFLRGNSPGAPAHFWIERGFTTIYGSNGAGKTSLVEGLAKGRRIVKGSIRLGNTDVTELDKNWVEENILLPSASSSSLIKEQMHQWKVSESRALEIFTRIGFKAKTAAAILGGQQKVSMLSKGQQARLTYAFPVIASGKPICILDEPFANLDPASAEEIVDLLKAITEQGEQSIICVDNTSRALIRADRLVCIEGDGQAVRVGTPLEVLQPGRLPSWAWPMVVSDSPVVQRAREELSLKETRQLEKLRTTEILFHKLNPDHPAEVDEIPTFLYWESQFGGGPQNPVGFLKRLNEDGWRLSQEAAMKIKESGWLKKTDRVPDDPDLLTRYLSPDVLQFA